MVEVNASPTSVVLHFIVISRLKTKDQGDSGQSYFPQLGQRSCVTYLVHAPAWTNVPGSISVPLDGSSAAETLIWRPVR